MPSILRDCPFSAIYWGGFETLRPIYSKLFLSHLTIQERDLIGFPAYITFLAGSTAGAIAAVCTHPFDVLKTRQQVGAWETTRSVVAGNSAGINGHSSKNVDSETVLSRAKLPEGRRPILSLVSIVRSEGLSALYRGLSMRMATVIPASAIMVTIYETIKKLDI